MKSKRSMQRNSVNLGSDSDDGGDHRRGGAQFGAFKVAFVNIVGGLIFGFAIGMTAILVFAHDKFERCAINTDQASCALFPQTCSWAYEESPSCIPAHELKCRAISSMAECNAASDHCHYSLSTESCEVQEGWNSFKTGMFVAAMTIGGLFGSLIAGKSRKQTRRRDLVLCALTFAVSTIASHIFYFTNDFWPLVWTRIGVGIAVGALCVLCPLYVGENADPAHASLFGALFQIFITLGIFAAALLGWLLQNDPRVAHAMLLVSNLIAMQLVPVAWMLESSCIPGSPASAASGLVDKERTASRSTPGLGALFEDPTVRVAFIAAMVLSCAQQLTGINAVMNYAPSMAKAAGYAPLTGNVLIMGWNFVTTLFSIPLANKYPPKTLFLSGLAGAATSCIVTYIGLSQQIAGGGSLWTMISALGMASFILFFECGMGPMFFILATEVFPKHLRDVGCSVVNVSQFIFNLIVAFAFPLVVEAWSPSPEMSIVGTSRTFALFGIVGWACFALLQKLL